MKDFYLMVGATKIKVGRSSNMVVAASEAVSAAG
jgi:hypothetical protein